MTTKHGTNTVLSRMLTPAEAAEHTGLSARTLRRDVATGKLRAYRRGRTLRYKVEDLEKLFTATYSWAV